MPVIRCKSRWLLITTFIYIYVPVAIFLLGYCRWYLAVPTVVIMAVMAIWMYRDFCEHSERVNDISISLPAFLAALVLIIIIGILIGIGGIYPQAGDWYKHNAVLRDLTVRSWPVYYSAYDPCMLTYYLGQYMVPALIGKILGHNFYIASHMMAIWAILGLVLAYLHLIRIVKANNIKKQLITLFVMFFFCGGLLLTQGLLYVIYGTKFYSMGSYHWILTNSLMLQLRSNLVMIRWVYPQVLVPWMVTMLLMEHRDRSRHFVILILPTLLFGSFSFAALAVMGIGLGVCNLLKLDLSIEERLKDLFSPSNIATALSLGTILFFYFLGNVQVAKPYSSTFRIQTYDRESIGVYIIFCLCMFGIYAICTFKEHRTEPLYYINLAILLILPFFRMGLCNDVVMSGSIPSLWIIMIFNLELIFNKPSAGIRSGIIIMLMFIGCVYPVLEIRDNIQGNTKGAYDLYDGYKTMEQFTDRSDSANISEDLLFNYYTYDMDGKVFYEYIARYKIVED